MKIIFTMLMVLLCTVPSFAEEPFEKDIIKTSAGDLEIAFIGHASLMFKLGDKIIHVDPFSKLADYEKLPKADIILLTHHHRDHLDTSALSHIRTRDTILIITKTCSQTIDGGKVMQNGESTTISDIKIEAVPAYNIVHKRDNGDFFHPAGEGNGYILTIGDKRIYIAGDTENIPEMKKFKNIDIAFLPMNLPYTMTVEMAADAANSFNPKILYPYHYGDTDVSKFVNLLKKNSDIEIRVRNMK